MRGLSLRTFDEVRKILDDLAYLYPLRTKAIKTTKSLGYILAEDVMSPSNVPAFDRSIVDGYAVIDTDTIGVSDGNPIQLKVVGEVAMGQASNQAISTGETLYVPTGGMIPRGATTMVMIEDVDLVSEEEVAINIQASVGEHIIFEGADMKAGDLIIKANKRITATDIGALCAVGKSEVMVYEPVSFIVLSTGDELIEISETQEKGQIYDINSHILSNLILQRGDRLIYRKIIKDDYKTLLKEIKHANQHADIVLICGGSSVGVRDFTESIIKSLDGGQVFIHGAAVKPGKPTIVGKANDKLIFGLPGHPVSSVMSFKMFAEYLMDTALKQKKPFNFRGVLTKDVPRIKGKTAFVMVDVDYQEHITEVTPNFGLSSMITWLSNSMGFIIVEPDGENLKVGQEVKGYYIN